MLCFIMSSFFKAAFHIIVKGHSAVIVVTVSFNKFRVFQGSSVGAINPWVGGNVLVLTLQASSAVEAGSPPLIK